MKHKFNARATTCDGYRFPSLAEAARYRELCLLQQAGLISALSVHPAYCLQPGFKDNTGKRQRAIKYEADFAYIENGKNIVEDVKGAETPLWIIKKKLFLFRYPEQELRVIKC